MSAPTVAMEDAPAARTIIQHVDDPKYHQLQRAALWYEGLGELFEVPQPKEFAQLLDTVKTFQPSAESTRDVSMENAVGFEEVPFDWDLDRRPLVSGDDSMSEAPEEEVPDRERLMWG